MLRHTELYQQMSWRCLRNTPQDQQSSSSPALCSGWLQAEALQQMFQLRRRLPTTGRVP
ncbi:hypothetical protein RRSWK_01398 [Rhodopirellula sp. SWK7]|nr:hypothetical protein RRSWK_01398 [Rhodopirellula sp. SWK7]